MTAIPHGSGNDLNWLELLKLRFQNLATDPATPSPGWVYFNTAIGAVKVCIVGGGSPQWLVLDPAQVANGYIPLAKLAVDPLARANHTGTQTAATISNFDAQVRTSTLNQMAAPTADVSMASFKITNVATGVAAGDAVNLAQLTLAVSNAAAGIDSKPSVRLLSNANIGLTGLAAIDGVTPVANDRVLAVGQTTASQNGVYVAAAGAWTRAVDADATGELTPGATWFVEEGTSFGATTWRQGGTGAIIVGTTSISITQLASAATYTASNGVVKIGNDFQGVVAAGSLLTLGASGFAVDKTKLMQGIAVTFGNATVGPFTLTHSFATEKIAVEFRDSAAPKRKWQVGWSIVDSNSISVEPDIAIAAGALTAVISGVV
jgi:hypothetical protein